jgi:hypothetical protein
MPPRQLHRFTAEKGFVSAARLIPGVVGSLIAGSNVWCRGAGLVESSKGAASSTASGGVAHLQNVAATHGGMGTSGSGTSYFSAYFFAGSGNFYVGGSSQGAAGSSVTIRSSAGLFNAGLTAPGAPTIAISPTASAKMNGSYSICLTAIRSTTGAESSRGTISNAVTLTSDKLRISAFPAVPTGADTWGIYCSRRGFGQSGPWYHLADIASSTVAPYDFDFFDHELGGLPELDNDPPPPCTHCFAINDIIVAAGCYGGAGMVPSRRSFPEAFPPFPVYIPSGGSITGCKASGIDGTVIVVTATSTNLVRDSGTRDTPIQVEQWWPNIGFASQSAWCIVEDQLWGFTGQRGPIRAPINGDPDTSFAEAVMPTFTSLGFSASNAVVGFDPKTGCMIFASGSSFLAYDRTSGLWSPPHTLAFSCTSAVTVGGSLLLSDSGGTLYALEAGAGTSWSATYAWADGGFTNQKTIIRLRGNVSASCSMDVYKDLNSSSSQSTKTAAANHGTIHHLNLPQIESFTVKFSGSDAGGTQVHSADLSYIPHGTTVTTS